MKPRNLALALSIFAITVALLPSAHAVPSSTFTLDKSGYNPGDSGKASITFYNDQGALIRITSVDMSFSYFYQDGRVYSQDFITPALSMNVSNAAVSQPITLQFSLPNGIATGYFTPTITVTFNVFNGPSFGGPNQDSSRATTPVQVVASSSTQTIMFVFVATTLLFAALTFYFATRYYSNKAPPRPSSDK